MHLHGNQIAPETLQGPISIAESVQGA